MKSITDKEYKDYMEYKQAKANGQILTPSTLRLICEANNNDPETIGIYILESLHKIGNLEETIFCLKEVYERRYFNG